MLILTICPELRLIEDHINGIIGQPIHQFVFAKKLAFWCSWKKPARAWAFLQIRDLLKLLLHMATFGETWKNTFTCMALLFPKVVQKQNDKTAVVFVIIISTRTFLDIRCNDFNSITTLLNDFLIVSIFFFFQTHIGLVQPPQKNDQHNSFTSQPFF